MEVAKSSSQRKKYLKYRTRTAVDRQGKHVRFVLFYNINLRLHIISSEMFSHISNKSTLKTKCIAHAPYRQDDVNWVPSKTVKNQCWKINHFYGSFVVMVKKWSCGWGSGIKYSHLACHSRRTSRRTHSQQWRRCWAGSHTPLCSNG